MFLEGSFLTFSKKLQIRKLLWEAEVLIVQLAKEQALVGAVVDTILI